MTAIQLANLARSREQRIKNMQSLRDAKARAARSLDVWLVTLPLEDKKALKAAWEKAKGKKP